ncbi:MAG: NeuD/PglB/VioB family sugar acetyltransferase [Phycisphaeraceae bacterium]|nr:NeuD/PglB/VioB family sugar acetyltransferase [Phycisphaerae bacterium]MBX3391027.1 NeuD/PglB/VioB family sugar acetyltransferase [Phycisphaeraceae bacterium]
MPDDALREQLVLVGGGGHALVVAESARSAGWRVRGFLDDAPSPVAASRAGLERIGSLRDGFKDVAGIIAVGHGALRRWLIDHPGVPRWAVIIAPGAHVCGTASLGPGVFVAPGAVVHSWAVVGPHAIINTSAIVEHECVVGENVHVAPGAVIGGNASIGCDALVGLGAVVLPGVSIGERCVVGAGAVVTRDVAAGQTVAGVPARAWPVEPVRAG